MLLLCVCVVVDCAVTGTPSLGGFFSPVKIWPLVKKIDKFNFCGVIIVRHDITVCNLLL